MSYENSIAVFPQLIGNDLLKSKLYSDIKNGKLAHAYIIEGRPGSGRRTLAKNIAAALCCQNKNGNSLPCGKCENCRKIFSGICPDVITVRREAGKTGIGIETVRLLRGDVRIMPNELDYKIYIIEDADTMTPQAQNAFLLTLEEPPSYLLFLLTAESSRNMLETVRSRAPSLRVQPLKADEVAKIAIEGSKTAEKMKNDEPRLFDGIIAAADGSAGKALMLFESREKDAVNSRRDAATELCRLCASADGAHRLPGLLTPYCAKREDAAEMLKTLSLALRDLALLKKCETVPLRFFTDREAAEEICGRYTMTRLLLLYDAVDCAVDSLERNANTRLTLFALAQKAASGQK